MGIHRPSHVRVCNAALGIRILTYTRAKVPTHTRRQVATHTQREVATHTQREVPTHTVRRFLTAREVTSPVTTPRGLFAMSVYLRPDVPPGVTIFRHTC